MSSASELDTQSDSGKKATLSRRGFIQSGGSVVLSAGVLSQLTITAAQGSQNCPEASNHQSVLSESQFSGQSEILRRYERAAALEQGIGTKKVAFNTTLYPHWISDTDHFWYKRDSKTGYQYRLVNAKSGWNRIAFHHKALAKALSRATDQTIDDNNLPIADIDITLSPRTVAFTAFGKGWIFDNKRKTCKEKPVFEKGLDPWGSELAQRKVSPDGKKALFVRDYNLWIQDIASGKERALTEDGERFYFYASTPTVYGVKQLPVTLEAIWSPDSKRVFTQVIDTRDVKKAPPLVQYVPPDGSLRPKIIDPDRKLGWADDEHIETYQFLSINVDTSEIIKADYPPCSIYFPHYVGFFSGHRGWWGSNDRFAYFTDVARNGEYVRLIEFDTHSRKTKVLIEERSETAVTLIPIGSHVGTLIVPLPDTNELIWFSERSGWAHLYLYDLNTRRLKNAITQGEWLVRNVLHYDAVRRELFIQTAGRVTGRNPYYCDICRVNIDTGLLTTILSTDDHYVVCDKRSQISNYDLAAQGVAPSSRYIVATRSRVDTVPVSVLIDRDGNEQRKLEIADVSGLPDNWQWPEPVMLKAADGKTDIYGVVFRPTDFTPEKSYPIIDCSYYFGSPVGSFTNGNPSWSYLSPAAYAELGFIAVVILNRGNDGLRDVAFNSYQDPRHPLNPKLYVKSNKSDCVAGIKQLVTRYPYMDINRVGVTDFNTLPMALTGLLVYPEFYKVGVARNSLANWRMGALSMSGGDWPELEDLANNLKGKLLLVHGMLDYPLSVTMAFRMIDALQKANKPFDMLLLPNDNHYASGYAAKQTWDYFVRHLLSIEPPADFRLSIDYLNRAANWERRQQENHLRISSLS